MATLKQLLTNIRLGIINMRFQWINRNNKEKLQKYNDETELAGYNFIKKAEPLYLKLFIAGRSNKFILYRQQAAKIFSKLKGYSVSEKSIKHGSIYCRYNAQSNLSPESQVWFFDNCFVEIGMRPAYGKINSSYFRFKQSKTENEPEFLTTLKRQRFWALKDQYAYELVYTLNQDGDVTPKEMAYYPDQHLRKNRETLTTVEQRLTVMELTHFAETDLHMRRQLA